MEWGQPNQHWSRIPGKNLLANVDLLPTLLNFVEAEIFFLRARQMALDNQSLKAKEGAFSSMFLGG